MEHNIRDNDGDFDCSISYYVLQCSGCDTISFLENYSDTEMYDYSHDGEMKYYNRETIYPPRIARKLPQWLGNLRFIEDELYDVLQEIYVALQNDLPVLATQGTRTALEIAMTKKVGDKDTFLDKVNAFIEAGFMQKDLKQPLLDALNAGSASAHRGYKPNNREISEIFDLVEGIIHAVFIIPQKAKSVEAKTPKRKKS